MREKTNSDAEEQVSEEDNVAYEPKDTDTSESDEADEEVTHAAAAAAAAEGFNSKNGQIFWNLLPQHTLGRAAAEIVIKMKPGITRFAVTRVSDITCFELFMPFSIKRVIIAMTNLEGKNVYFTGKTLMRNPLMLCSCWIVQIM